MQYISAQMTYISSNNSEITDNK